MAHEVPWNRVILEEFERIAILSKSEKDILESRVIKNWSRVKQASYYRMSVSTVDNIIKVLKIKYDDARKYSDILPPRSKNPFGITEE